MAPIDDNKIYKETEAGPLIGLSPHTLRKWRTCPPKNYAPPEFIKSGRSVGYLGRVLRLYRERNTQR